MRQDCSDRSKANEKRNRLGRTEKEVADRKKENDRMFFLKNPWYRSYAHAKSRCTNKNVPSYKYYGAKGIKFLMTPDEFKYIWFRDKAFLFDTPTIDRKNPAKDYILENCRFVENSKNVSMSAVHRNNYVRGMQKNKKSSKYKGCFLMKRDNKYMVQFTVCNRTKQITSIKNEKIAALIYDLIAFDCNGMSGYLNFPDIVIRLIAELKKDVK